MPIDALKMYPMAEKENSNINEKYCEIYHVIEGPGNRSKPRMNYSVHTYMNIITFT